MNENKIALNIIDNTPGRELIKVIKDQIKKSKEAKFAIGYFFLSGFSLVKNDFPENYENLPFLKIIMGNETTYPTKEELVAGYNLREIFKQKMIENLQRIKFTEEQIKQLEALKDFVANNVIDVKLFEKSRLHAKLYLFATKPEEKYGSQGLAVVGSSNFTAEGLTKNKELNVLLTSREEVLYLNQWFDQLWNEAVEFKEDLLKVIDLSGIMPGSPYPKIGKLIDSHTLFKYLVYKWFEGRIFESLKKDILMEFQVIGVINAVEILNDYKGVILADSVGLGKSFMASGVIEDFLKRNHPTWVVDDKKIPSVLLILPPSIISQWEELLIGRLDEDTKNKLLHGERIRVPPMFEGRGFLVNNLKKLIKNGNNNKIYGIYDEKGVKLLGKIAFLSLGIFQNYKVDEEKGYVDPDLKKLAEEYDLFVIDEAHKYRNKNTNRWKAIRKLQKKDDGFSNRFLLLTATPLNNSINDIFNLIKLFTDDTFLSFKIKDIPINDLINKYRKIKRDLVRKDDDKIKRNLKQVATDVKQKILDKIMVLRTRKYILEQFKDIKVNGKPLIFKDPQPYSLDYSPFITKKYKNFIKAVEENLDNILFEYTKLYGTRFVVFEEESIDEKEGGKHYIEIADLFKLLLGKRLESGLYPFETTLKRIYEKEKLFYGIFKSQMNRILSREQLVDLVRDAVRKAKIDKDLEEIEQEYNIEEEDKETWFDRVVKILLNYAQESKEEEHYSEIELLKLGLNRILKNLENDLRLLDNIFVKLEDLKEKENGGYKTFAKIPRQKEDIIDLPIYLYSYDPKIESLKQIIGNPSFKSDALRDIPSLNRRKILIFTQYKDTAYYLYHNLLDWVKREIDLHTWLKDSSDRFKIGLVTGDTETSTKINYIKRFAPQANNGFEEVEKFGEIEILISTDALSEGVNLQDADTVINYDLPWNPMVIVQRVGRVNRIGNEKDVFVINYIPSKEIEVVVGVLRKLKEKIKDITLIVGKDVKILSQEEEINIETFGEKIRDISQASMTDLEQYGISDDFREFIPGGMSQEQIDKYKLINIIQYDLGYTKEDFEDIMKMGEGPYYSFVRGGDKIISVYEFYRGNEKVKKEIMYIDSDGPIKYETPLIFLDLIRNKGKNPEKIEKAIENLKVMQDKTDRDVEELKEQYQQEQRGFLYNLYNALLVERTKSEGIEDKFKIVMNTLQSLPYYEYSRNIKTLLNNENMIEIKRNNNIEIKNFKSVIEALYRFFKERGLTQIESLKIKVKHIGWYYEI